MRDLRTRVHRFVTRLVRSAGVGVVATVVDLATLMLLVRAGMDPRAASVPALITGVGVQFVGNKFVTFDERSSAWLAQGLGFALVEVTAFALNLIVFDWGIRHTAVPFPVVRVLSSSLVYFGFSLPLWSVVFRERRRTS